MEKSLTLSVLCFGFVLLGTVNSFPIDISTVSEGVSNPLWLTNSFLTGFGFFLLIISIIFGCVCCRNGKGFKEFRNSSGNLAFIEPEGFVNPTSNSELTIFPPLGANANEICRFEPLPDIKSSAPNLRPAAFSSTEQEISSQDWFTNPSNNFPRNQLKYVQEYGRGWFGRVVEGEAQNIIPEEKVTKVMVKILHEDATPTDHMYFLHEVKFYRDLKHHNILNLLGQCLETEPFLIILECYLNGDLKTFLSQNLASAQALVEQGVTLQMCSNITSGLQFMHDNKFIHTDLAARNCLVGPDLSIKIGDYGNSIEIFKSDYYCAGSVALPIRWCAPETLKCTDITIETREVTPPANIWSLGVVFWEICEFCELPYAELNDDQVIVRVLGEKNYFLEKPNMVCLHKDEMYHLMKLCWKPPVQRPNASQILLVLNNLISSSKMIQKETHSDLKQISQDFEQRWQNLKPNSIPKKDNAIDSDCGIVDCSIISSKLKNAKVVDSSYIDSPLGIFLSNKSSDSESPRFCLKFDKKADHKIEKSSVKEVSEREKTSIESIDVVPKKSVDIIDLCCTTKAKILNSHEGIKGAESEMDSWLKGVEINNEEDESFVRKISEAIRDLDETLAMEKTSSSEENSGKSTRQNSPGKEVKETNELVVDFQLGNDTSSFINFTQKAFDIAPLQNTEQPQSLNFTDHFNDKSNQRDENSNSNSLILPFVEDRNKCKDEILYESLKENDSSLCGQSRNSSDTDDEIWRRRIEKGEISEKVKEKSKSIANLMILTHIDSDDSDIDFDKPFEKGLTRSSFIRRSGSFAKSSLSSNNFGSENDLTFAVLEDDFKESLKKLTNDHKEHGHFDSLGVILPYSANRENVWESLFKPTDSLSKTSNEATFSQMDTNKILKDSKMETESCQPANFSEENYKQNTENRNNFLGNVASEKFENSKPVKENLRTCTSLNEEPIGKFNEKNCFGAVENTILLEKNLKYQCDNEKWNTNFNDSPRNSSHLKESDLGSDFDEKNCILETPFWRSVSNKSSSLKEKTCNNERPDDVKASSFLDKGNLSSGEERSDRHIETENFVSPKNSLFPLVFKISESQHSKDIDSSHEKAAIKAELNIVTGDNIFESNNTEYKSFKSILKNDHFIPKITVTEESDEDLHKSEGEKFEFEKPKIRPLKFVLKDHNVALTAETKTKIVEDEKKKSESYFPSVSEKFTIRSCSNESEKNALGENATVIVGACEDFTMDYFKGLKTTSKDLNVEKENIGLINSEENLDIWDKHLEKTFTQQFRNTNFDDISFKSFGLDYFDASEVPQCNSFNTVTYPIKKIMDFIESEKNHTDKLEESIHINRLINLSVIANEEEYEHFKLRTPDDERSSDSGFRDKGSLSESVEDACEGKYNLEDIEAELEEAFVKEAFRNCDSEKEKYSTNDSKNCNNFEYEESKFYEDESKNEEDFSDIDGEIEFWHNKDESDYYPEISEFHPTCSQGWYLHPPDDSMLTFDRHVNEDIVNALRNELRESLPVQSRSYDKFNDFYESEIEDAKRELNIHYISDFALPLSPILEEQDSSKVAIEKNIKNTLLDGNSSNKIRKSIIKLMESVKAVDTNTFMQYLDYMIENEGRDLNEIKETEDDTYENKESENSSMLILMEEESKNLKGNLQKFSEDTSKKDIKKNNKNLGKASDDDRLLKYLEPENSLKDEELNSNFDILALNLKINKTTLFVKKPEYLEEAQEPKNDCLEVLTDTSENEGLVFTPEILSPDRERSISEISRSSNGTRTGDALSEITLSSPDLVPDCFSTSVQETVPNKEGDEIIEKINQTDAKTKLDPLDDAVVSQDSVKENPELLYLLTKFQMRNYSFLTEGNNHTLTDLEKTLNVENKKLKFCQNNLPPSDFVNPSDTSDVYEMSTSFMGEDDNVDDKEEIFSNSGKFEHNQAEEEQIMDRKTRKDSLTEDSDTADWQLDSSEDEEMSSSSGEFIWKDGNRESKIKAIHASDFVITENSLYDRSQSDQSGTEISTNEVTFLNKSIDEKRGENFDEVDQKEEDDNESSTGSSASITDFVPSAWNSLAIPSRPVLRSPDKKTDKQKKNVWFKKQKYHCVYEYPREPSDNEDADVTSFKLSSLDKNLSETPMKHFNYGVNIVELPNHHFPYGISKVFDFSSFTDWDVVEGEDPDLSLTDTDSDNGTGKTDLKNSDPNFYNLSPFDYDFNVTDLHDGESEFFVSSSSRPFQGSSSIHFLPGGNESVCKSTINVDNEIIKNNAFNFKDFTTPDSGVEDSVNVTPSDKVDLNQENILKMKNLNYSKSGVIDILGNIKINVTTEMKDIDAKEIEFESLEVNTKSKNGFSNSDASTHLSNVGLGELRHTLGNLKLDLPRNHNTELGAIINNKNQ